MFWPHVCQLYHMHACCSQRLEEGDNALHWSYRQLRGSHSRVLCKSSKCFQLQSNLSSLNTVLLWAQLSVKQGFTILTNNQMKSAHEQGNAVWTDWESKWSMEEKREASAWWRRWGMQYLRRNVNKRSTDKNMSPFNCKTRFIQTNLYLESPEIC